MSGVDHLTDLHLQGKADGWRFFHRNKISGSLEEDGEGGNEGSFPKSRGLCQKISSTECRVERWTGRARIGSCSCRLFQEVRGGGAT